MVGPHRAIYCLLLEIRVYADPTRRTISYLPSSWIEIKYILPTWQRVVCGTGIHDLGNGTLLLVRQSNRALTQTHLCLNIDKGRNRTFMWFIWAWIHTKARRMLVTTDIGSVFPSFGGVTEKFSMGWESKIGLPGKFPEAVCYSVYVDIRPPRIRFGLRRDEVIRVLNCTRRSEVLSQNSPPVPALLNGEYSCLAHSIKWLRKRRDIPGLEPQGIVKVQNNHTGQGCLWRLSMDFLCSRL